MSDAEIAYLALVIVAALVFAATLAGVSAEERRNRK